MSPSFGVVSEQALHVGGQEGNSCPPTDAHHWKAVFSLSGRKLEKAVAVSGVCAGVLKESSGKIPGKLLENFSRIAKCYKF